MASTPNTRRSLITTPSPSELDRTSSSSTQVSGTTFAHSSCAIHASTLKRVANESGSSLLLMGGSWTRNKPSLEVETQRQHGKSSGSAGFGGSLRVRETLVADAVDEVFGRFCLGSPGRPSGLRFFGSLIGGGLSRSASRSLSNWSTSIRTLK